MTAHHHLQLGEHTREEVVSSLAESWREDNPGSVFTDYVRQRIEETAGRNLRIEAHFPGILTRERLGLTVCGNPSDRAYAYLEERGVTAADWMRGQLLYDLQLVIGDLHEKGLLRRDSDIGALRHALVRMGDKFTESPGVNRGGQSTTTDRIFP